MKNVRRHISGLSVHNITVKSIAMMTRHEIHLRSCFVEGKTLNNSINVVTCLKNEVEML